MGTNDKTISKLTQLPIDAAADIGAYVNDLYLVSHPNGGGTTDYTTHNIPLSDLANLVVSSAYETISSKVSTDLSLGELAHLNALSSNNHINGSIVRLDMNVSSTTYSMLAKPPALMTCISAPDNVIRNKLGFKELAFRDESYLSLGALAHKSYITSADVEEYAKFPSTQIDVPFRNLCLSDESMLSLSALAHQDVVQPNQVVSGLSLEQLVLTGPHGWQTSCDDRYLSAPTRTSRGSIGIGYGTSNDDRNYALTTDTASNANGYVNVPWENKDHYTSCSLKRTRNVNTLEFVQKISSIVDTANDKDTTVAEVTSTIDITPVISDNLTGAGAAGKIAIFSAKHSLSAGAKLTANVKTKYYQANGEFGSIPSADNSTYGLVKTNGEKNHLAVFSGSNTFTSGAELSTNVVNKYYRADGKFETIPTANKSTLGLVKLDGVSNTLAVFSGTDGLSAGASLTAGVIDKYYRADGKFESIPHATHDTYGLMKSNGVANKIAIFSGSNTLSSGASLTAGATDKYYRADGSFGSIPTATSSNLGLVQLGYTYNSFNGNNIPISSDNGKLFASVPTATPAKLGMIKVGYTKTDTNFPVQLDSDKAYVNVPQATNAAPGTIKVGFTRSETKLPVQLDSGKAYVDAPYATTSLPGTIKLGASRTSDALPVQLDNLGRAYVSLTGSGSSSGSSGSFFDEIAASVMKSLYPVGAIYLTIAASCPMEGIGGMRWTKVEGRYLLASGQLDTNESFAAGNEVAAGLPAHTHTVSFNFSSSSSTSGYPHHGGGSTCAHSSYNFTSSGASNRIYGSSRTVRPKAYVVNVFRRIQ